MKIEISLWEKFKWINSSSFQCFTICATRVLWIWKASKIGMKGMRKKCKLWNSDKCPSKYLLIRTPKGWLARLQSWQLQMVIPLKWFNASSFQVSATRAYRFLEWLLWTLLNSWNSSKLDCNPNPNPLMPSLIIYSYCSLLERYREPGSFFGVGVPQVGSDVARLVSGWTSCRVSQLRLDAEDSQYGVGDSRTIRDTVVPSTHGSPCSPRRVDCRCSIYGFNNVSVKKLWFIGNLKYTYRWRHMTTSYLEFWPFFGTFFNCISWMKYLYFIGQFSKYIIS